MKCPEKATERQKPDEWLPTTGGRASQGAHWERIHMPVQEMWFNPWVMKIL